MSGCARVCRRRQPRAASPTPPPEALSLSRFPAFPCHRKPSRHNGYPAAGSPHTTMASARRQAPCLPRLIPHPHSRARGCATRSGAGRPAVPGRGSRRIGHGHMPPGFSRRSTNAPPYMSVAMAVDIPRCLKPALAEFFSDNQLRRRAKVTSLRS